MPEPVIERFPPESLVLHELAHLVPETPADQYAAILADVQALGEIEEPLKRIPGTNPPVIIDGRTRRKAAMEAKIPFVPVQDAVLRGDSPVVYMLRVARLRRHLTADQLAALGAELLEQIEKEAAERKKAGAKKGGETAGRGREKPADSVGATPAPRQSDPAPARAPAAKPARAPRSAEIAAEKVGSTRRKVSAAAEVKKKAPELHEKVKAGTKTLKAAVAEVKAKEPPKPAPAKKLEPKKEPQVVATVKGGPIEMLPCPFCGCKDVTVIQEVNWIAGKNRDQHVRCDDCGAVGPNFKSVEAVDTRQAWNKRAAGVVAVTMSTPLTALLAIGERSKAAALEKLQPGATIQWLFAKVARPKAGADYIWALYAYLREIPGLGRLAAEQIGDALVELGFATSAGPVLEPKPEAPAEAKPAPNRRAAK